MPVDQVKRYEAELYDYMRVSGAEVLEEIRQTRALKPETAAKLDKALGDFTAIFLAGVK